MAGLPRSGSTLLSAILNQNPDFYVGPATDLPRMMIALHQEIQKSESFVCGYNPQGYFNVVKEIPNNFYANIDRKYIVDKNRTWGTPDYLQLLDAISSDVKIICPVRPILEILASFVRLAEQNPNNFIDALLDEIPAGSYRARNDSRCDVLMAPNKQIEQNILSIASALIPEHASKFHFVVYSDLVNKPQETMFKIYEFLNLPNFQHNFNHLIWTPMPNEAEVYGIPNLHSIQPQLRPSQTDVAILSDYVKTKYERTLDFLHPRIKI